MVWMQGTIAGERVVTAPALGALFDEINAHWPNRVRGNGDGTIGDASHLLQGSSSDHNPQLLDDGRWYVMALDVQHDFRDSPDAFNSYAFADFLADRIARGIETRIQYIVSNGRICNIDPIGTAKRGEWRFYNGSDPHTGHVHISLRHKAALANDTSTWIPDVHTADELPEEDMAIYVRSDAPGKADGSLLDNGWAVFEVSTGRLNHINGEINEVLKAAGADVVPKAIVVPAEKLNAAIRKAGLA